ncbi:MAG: hypothetical protein ACRCS0_06300 [Albidovulum sp.]
MRLSTLTLFAALAVTTAGCVQSGGYGQPGTLQTQGGRAVAGALVGAAAADAFDENMVAGAALGALAGGASCNIPGPAGCQ